MYEHITPERLQDEVKRRTDGDLLQREGSFFEMHTKPVAYILSELYHQLDATIPIAFVDETSGKYLEMRAAEFGITRKPGYRATLTLHLTGQNGCSVPAGTRFSTADGLVFETLQSVTIGAGGTADVPAAAAALGSLYNVPKNTVTRPVQAVSKLDTATNPAPAVGGMDPETDAALFRRLDAFRRTPGTSGNRAHYEQWAMEVNGVGAARCIEIWDGPGTVKVIVADMEIRPVTEQVRKAVADHIEAVRPVCPKVTVVSAVGVDVAIRAQVKLTGSGTAQGVQAAFRAAMEQYISETVFDNPQLSYNRIAYLLMSCAGVADYTALTVNGGTESIDLPLGKVPVLTTVEVTAGA